jgi:hypothetical protein
MVLHPGMGSHRTPGQLRHVPYHTADEDKEALARQRQEAWDTAARNAVFSSSSVRSASDGGAGNAFLFLACIGTAASSASRSRTSFTTTLHYVLYVVLLRPSPALMLSNLISQ